VASYPQISPLNLVRTYPLSPIRATCRSHLIFLDFITRIMFRNRLHGFVIIVTIHTFICTQTSTSKVSISLFRYVPLSTVAVCVQWGWSSTVNNHYYY
jgi:hypothetical protein